MSALRCLIPRSALFSHRSEKLPGRLCIHSSKAEFDSNPTYSVEVRCKTAVVSASDKRTVKGRCFWDIVAYGARPGIPCGLRSAWWALHSTDGLARLNGVRRWKLCPKKSGCRERNCCEDIFRSSREASDPLIKWSEKEFRVCRVLAYKSSSYRDRRFCRGHMRFVMDSVSRPKAICPAAAKSAGERRRDQDRLKSQSRW